MNVGREGSDQSSCAPHSAAVFTVLSAGSQSVARAVLFWHTGNFRNIFGTYLDDDARYT